MRKTLQRMISQKYPQQDSDDKKNIISELGIDYGRLSNILKDAYWELQNMGLVYNHHSEIEYHHTIREWLNPKWDGFIKQDILPTTPTNSIRFARVAKSQIHYARKPATLQQLPAPPKSRKKKF